MAYSTLLLLLLLLFAVVFASFLLFCLLDGSLFTHVFRRSLPYSQRGATRFTDVSVLNLLQIYFKVAAAYAGQ